LHIYIESKVTADYETKMERTIGIQIKLLKLYLSISLSIKCGCKKIWQSSTGLQFSRNTFGLQRILAITLTFYFVCL